MEQKRHNKKHPDRAKSFKRIAKNLRKIAETHRPIVDCLYATLQATACAFDAEAKFLRSPNKKPKTKTNND